MSHEVEIVEVSPRDGLQNEAAELSTAAKIELIGRAIAAGARRIEATSFVSPRAVPRLADAEEVMAGVPREGGVSYIGLVVNERGLDRAVAAGVDEINYIVVASDTFSQRNQSTTTDAAIARWATIADRAREAGLRAGVTVAAAFGCPFEGNTPRARVREIVARLADSGPDEISLADTIGVAAPAEVADRLALVRQLVPQAVLRCHLHDTRGTGLANAYAALEAGVDVLDSSIAGIGGCPFAPAATGNIATEDLIYMLDRMDVSTGLSMGPLIEAGRWLAEALGKPVTTALGRAGAYP